MRFKDLFHVLKQNLGGDKNIPDFFREFIGTITQVPESEWGGPKDPTLRLKDGSINTYCKTEPSRKFARSLAPLDTGNLLEFIDKQPLDVRMDIVCDLQPYALGEELTDDNIACKVADFIEQIIDNLAKGIHPSNADKIQAASLSWASRYGNYLLHEEEYNCPFPGCGKELCNISGTNRLDNFNVCLIDKQGPVEVSNMIALCPSCFAEYLDEQCSVSSEEMLNIKNTLKEHQKSKKIANATSFNEGMARAIRKISQISINDLKESKFDPKKLTDKIDAQLSYPLYKTVSDNIFDYYNILTKVMVGLDKRGKINYDSIQFKIGGLYSDLKETGRSQIAIFDEMVERLHKATLEDRLYCQILVSFFIQKCEVF